jgi:hypothetical protein
MKYFFTRIYSPGIQASFLHRCKVINFPLVYRGPQKQNTVLTADQNEMEEYEMKLPADRDYVVLVKELTWMTTCERHV